LRAREDNGMARMVVIYRSPPDPRTFDRHYFEVHVPLAKQLPGLRKYEVSTGAIVALNAARDPYMIATLHFDDLAAIRAAFATETGQACAADRKLLAPDDAVQTFLFEDREI
jgi:uncharacterized protein (TIGR02118 family)